jgi:hypothetical protein
MNLFHWRNDMTLGYVLDVFCLNNERLIDTVVFFVSQSAPL